MSDQLGVSLIWEADIPPSWRLVRFGSVATEVREPNLDGRQRNRLSLSYGRIVPRDIESADGLLPESFNTYNRVLPNDVVLRLTDLQNDKRSLRTALTNQSGIITSAYVSVRPHAVDPRFLAYYLRAADLAKLFYSLGGGLRQSIGFADIKALRLPLPPSREQRAIADYLDHETAEIDAFIKDARLLSELEAERSLAQSSVWLTQGTLKGQALTATHGVDWLDGAEVPAHWRSVKLGLIARLASGDSIIATDIATSGEYPVYGGGGFRGYTSTWTHREDQVLFGRQGALCGQVFRGEGPFFATEHAVVAKPTVRLDQKWLESMLRFMNLGQYSTSAAQPGLSVDDISKLKIVQPPLEEQRMIGTEIATHERSVISIQEDLKSAIELARERRSALISAAVTGQIDVTQRHKPVAEVLEDEVRVGV